MALRRCSGCRIKALLWSSFPPPVPSTFNSFSASINGNGYTFNTSVSFLGIPSGLLRPDKTTAVPLNSMPTMPFSIAKLTMLRAMSSSSRSKLQDGSKDNIPKASGANGKQQKSETGVLVFFRSMQEKMKSEELPTAAMGLGLAGAIPFVLLTPPFCSVLPLPEFLCARPLEAQAAYGAVILSFLGGPHWGLGMVRTHAPPHDKVFNINVSTFRFMWGVVPSLIAWPALLLSDIPKMSVLIVSFALVLGVDAWCSIQGLLPPWYLPLRVLLSLVVLLCLISSTLHAYSKEEKSIGELIEG
eukprot:Gb_34281 [translate_table: standard]